ncbi:MAG: class I SAM-dependent methyltransferase [Lachnospiraceae bacterium]|nr:class I SAM-dependent methyltransferase [Lachnospiraceae bacterium]
MDIYSGFADVYDSLMDNVPYREWTERIISRLKENGIEDGLVLDLGCGTGTVCELLSEAGYDMIGVDASADMLRLANEKKIAGGHDILYLLQDMRSFELYGTVRAVICICDSLNYLLEEEELLECFRLVNNYLDPGGLFLFDFNTVHKYRDVIGETVIAEKREECSFIWENSYEDGINDCELTVFMKAEDGRYDCMEEEHLQRGYEPAQIRAALDQAGMIFVGAEDSESGGEPDETSERIFVTAREKGKKAS